MDWSEIKVDKRNIRQGFSVIILERDNGDLLGRQQYIRREEEIFETGFVERIIKIYDGLYVLVNGEGEVIDFEIFVWGFGEQRDYFLKKRRVKEEQIC